MMPLNQPVPSNHPEVLNANAKTIDEVASSESNTAVTRTGKTVLTLQGLEAAAAERLMLEIDSFNTTSGGFNFGLSTRPLVELTINAQTTQISFTQPSTGGFVMRLILKQGTGANKVNWSGVKWPNGSPPVLSFDEGATDLLTFIVTANGVYGIYNGGWY